jgi:aminoglycoside phosphotransferase (APT) family kinase protein
VNGDVVRTREQAARLTMEPLLVLDPLGEFLDRAGLGEGPIEAVPIGDGHSNVTYLLRRGQLRLVLRRPPRGPLAPSANDVLRESRLLRALAATSVPVPEVLAVCEDETVIGAPFCLMAFIEGEVISVRPPGGGLDPRRLAEQLIETLLELHEVDFESVGLADLGRPSGYLERQLRRFGGLLEHNATRPLPELERIARWLAAELPDSPPATIVHGDYRLGNVMYSRRGRLVAVLDWELATIGDPLADLGYCTAMWAEPGDAPNPMLELSRATRGAGFPNRAELAERYARDSGHDLSALGWYQVLALWKAAIFLEGSYRRYREGATGDEYFADLDGGVPLLARFAASLIGQPAI